jgi:predicted NAD/FAD-dependent oxidoreductase
MTPPRNIAIIGAGMSGVVCARTLLQAGHRVTLFEKSAGVGGRMATRQTPFGSFDHGAQYFTVRDPRFERALQTVKGLCKPWSATTVRVLDNEGRVAAAGLPAREPHWVPAPGMNSLVQRWAEPLAAAGNLYLLTEVMAIEHDALHPQGWQLRTEGERTTHQVFSGFDTVILALPAAQAHQLLQAAVPTSSMARQVAQVEMAPCWTLMLAFPQAMQPGLSSLGPQWNVARSTHHRMAWLARESSKPGRDSVERWTAQASAAWSQEHVQDEPERVHAKLLKAFAEVTHIRAEPSFSSVHRWRYAQTTKPLGASHLWDAAENMGVCGDWCLGHRVENAFVSGLELALNIAAK